MADNVGANAPRPSLLKKKTTAFRHGLGAVGLVGALAMAPTASAQYTHDPFFEQTLLQSQAIGFEHILRDLRMIEALDRPYPSVLTEIVHDMVGRDRDRFSATLAGLDPALAVEFFQVIDAIDEGVERNELVALDVIDVVSLIQVGFALLDDAYALVVPQETQNDPVFKAAIMAQLLLGDGGVAEGLAEAFEEEWQFANGWAATQRIKVLWEDIRGLATPEQQFEIDDAIAALDAIYPSVEPPQTFAGLDPEAAETVAQRMVGFLESIVDAQLYSGRDELRLVAHLAVLATEGCAHYEAGADELGREVIYAVYDHYAGETTGLGAVMELFSPATHAMAMSAFDVLVAVDDDDDGGLQTIGELVNADEAAAPGAEATETEEMDGSRACRTLLEGLDEGRAVLGG